MLAQYLSYEFIALFMFITMLVMMFTGQRVFGAIGFVAAASALLFGVMVHLKCLTQPHGNFLSGIQC